MKSCNSCKHLKRDKGYYCAAFPNGIPFMFLSGHIEHDTVRQGQTGKIIWEQITK